MRHGTVMSLTGTASGWLFAAHRPRAAVLAVLEAEHARADASFEERLAEVRRRGMARAVDLSMPGVSALAAPVFDGTGALVLSITAIGATAAFDTRWDGTLAAALRRMAGDLSRRLGWKSS
jgi:DNA-binding IclR family transcriptional regulator